MTGHMPEWKTLVERLERLERQNRRLKRGGILGLRSSGPRR